MNDFELLSIVLMILAIIVNLIIALLNERKREKEPRIVKGPCL